MIEVRFSSSHGEKLRKLLDNSKIPKRDIDRVRNAIDRYENWLKELDRTGKDPDTELIRMVRLLNDYKRFIDVELIFDAEDDFLYRQKGQLKLDNSILEEFLPRLFDEKFVPGFHRIKGLECGPKGSFAGLSFDSPAFPLSQGGVYIKLKDQDFSVTKLHEIKVTSPSDEADQFSTSVAVSYFATEIKTNLDKTMFQEASQTAGELKRAVSGAKYILLCEWLDMTPINTRLTPIDEVIVLRKAKRLPSNVRKEFASYEGRKKYRNLFVEHLDRNPMSSECFKRFLLHLNECFPESKDDPQTVLNRGYF